MGLFSAIFKHLSKLTNCQPYFSLSAIVAGIEAGWVNPVINREYAMEEVQQVHYDIIHSKGAKGKLVLSVSKEEAA